MRGHALVSASCTMRYAAVSTCCGNRRSSVARHAGVSKARVHVSADHRLHSAMIADHGKGFDPDAVLGAGAISPRRAGT